MLKIIKDTLDVLVQRELPEETIDTIIYLIEPKENERRKLKYYYESQKKTTKHYVGSFNQEYWSRQ